MSQARNGHSTAEESKPTRRTALTLAAGLAAVASLGTVAVAGPASNKIATLFGDWQIAMGRLDKARDLLTTTFDLYEATKPKPPASILHANVTHWRDFLSRYVNPIDYYVTAPGWSALAQINQDEWISERLSAAQEYSITLEKALVAAGHRAAEAGYDVAFDDVYAIERRLVTYKPTNLDEARMLVRCARHFHEGIEIGPLEEILFASILGEDPTEGEA